MKRLIKTLAVIVLVLLALLIAFVQKIDRSPLEDTTHYKEWKTWINQQDFVPEPAGTIAVGWAKINITPDYSVPMAGHGNRWGKHFESIRDSLYVRAISLSSDKGEHTLTFVSADLLIIPPNVTERLGELLATDHISANEIHLGATHTHHSMGGWGRKLAGRLFAGKFDLDVEEMLAQKLRDAIVASRRELIPAKVLYVETDYEEGIRNRLNTIDSIVDPEIRGLIFLREDSSRAVLVAYGAHSTVLRRDSLYLSRDYPGHLVDRIEKDEQTDFALFMAGAVGSMGFIADGETPAERAINLGERLADEFTGAVAESSNDTGIDRIVNGVSILSEWVSVPLPPQTARISINYALRPWVFNAFFGQSPGDIKISLIGRTLLLGMPADFSGEIMVELDEYARSRDIDLVITSFNGYYTGYITHDRHYDKDLYETITMSWNGYSAGDYYTEIARDIIDKIAAEIPERISE